MGVCKKEGKKGGGGEKGGVKKGDRECLIDKEFKVDAACFVVLVVANVLRPDPAPYL